MQFSDATLEIGPGVVTPFFAGLRASIEPHILFGKILKNLELDRTKVIDTPITGSNGPTKEFLADEFTVELEHAWVTVYGMIADTMIEAAEN